MFLLTLPKRSLPPTISHLPLFSNTRNVHSASTHDWSCLARGSNINYRDTWSRRLWSRSKIRPAWSRFPIIRPPCSWPGFPSFTRMLKKTLTLFYSTGEIPPNRHWCPGFTSPTPVTTTPEERVKREELPEDPIAVDNSQAGDPIQAGDPCVKIHNTRIRCQSCLPLLRQCQRAEKPRAVMDKGYDAETFARRPKRSVQIRSSRSEPGRKDPIGDHRQEMYPTSTKNGTGNETSRNSQCSEGDSERNWRREILAFQVKEIKSKVILHNLMESSSSSRDCWYLEGVQQSQKVGNVRREVAGELGSEVPRGLISPDG